MVNAFCINRGDGGPRRFQSWVSADFWFFVDAQSVVLRVSGVVLRVSGYWGVGGCDWGEFFGEGFDIGR